VLGNQVEMDMMQSIEENETLLRVGIAFQSMEARHRVSEALERNYERCELPCFLCRLANALICSAAATHRRLKTSDNCYVDNYSAALVGLYTVSLISLLRLFVGSLYSDQKWVPGGVQNVHINVGKNRRRQ
jgi:hypothetical protein